jgi:peptide/nickel transport system substrate-binding protein
MRPALAQQWIFGEKPKGVLKVADFQNPSVTALLNYAEGLISLDKDGNWVPCLAVDARWRGERTIEFKLREGVTFHNGEKFNAEAVRINWEAYKKMKSPRPISIIAPSDKTELKIVDEYTVQFTFPEPDGLAFIKFQFFFLFAPSFFEDHKFEEGNWGYLSEPGPWGSGAFKLVEGSLRFGRPSDQVILEANANYWDRRYPKVQRVIFENSLMDNRDEAMRLCRESEGNVDIVNFIRPLDTLKIAKSRYAKAVKSRDASAFLGTFNMRKTGSKWRDIRLRKALNYAINRAELFRYVAKGNAYNLEGFPIAQGAYGHNPNLTPLIHDTEKARSLLEEAGYTEGFEVKVITLEAVKLEAQIMKRMLERVGLRVNLDVLTFPEWYRKFYIPLLDKPPEEQEWDLSLFTWQNYYGNPAATFLNFVYLEESDFRWIKYDPIYEKMWEAMAKTVDVGAQEERIRELVKYVYDRAYSLSVYSPLTLYAVNKEVEFVPYEDSFLHFKETSVTENHWSVRGKND